MIPTHEYAAALQEAEDLRRSPQGTMSVRPGPPLVYEVFDYSTPLQAIATALAHLDEGLPAGQRHRVVAAYSLLRRGTEDLGRWLRDRGVPV